MIVLAELPVDAVITPTALTVDCAALIAAGVTVTAAVWAIATLLRVALTVFASATVELNVPVVVPLAIVAAGCVIVAAPPDELARINAEPRTERRIGKHDPPLCAERQRRRRCLFEHSRDKAAGRR